eukprot:394677-Amphidinium_carterae.3
MVEKPYLGGYRNKLNNASYHHAVWLSMPHAWIMDCGKSHSLGTVAIGKHARCVVSVPYMLHTEVTQTAPQQKKEVHMIRFHREVRPNALLA